MQMSRSVGKLPAANLLEKDFGFELDFSVSDRKISSCSPCSNKEHAKCSQRGTGLNNSFFVFKSSLKIQCLFCFRRLVKSHRIPVPSYTTISTQNDRFPEYAIGGTRRIRKAIAASYAVGRDSAFVLLLKNLFKTKNK